MYNQLKVAFIKLISSRFAYISILGFVMFALAHAGIFGIGNIPTYTFPEALLAVFSDTSLLFVLSLFVSYFIGNDFANRTIGNEIKIGYTRLSAIISRTVVALPFAVLVYLAYALPFALIMGARHGFGGELAGFGWEPAAHDVGLRTVLFALQLMAILSFTVFFMFWSKKSSLGMMVGVCFVVAVCNILRNYLIDNAFYKMTPFYRIMINYTDMTPQDVQLSFVSAIATIVAVMFATYIVFRKAELK